MSNVGKVGIVDKVKRASSKKEVDALVKEAEGYQFISVPTLRKVYRKAKLRKVELYNSPVETEIETVVEFSPKKPRNSRKKKE